MATKLLALSGGDYTTFAGWCAYANALNLAADEFLDIASGGAISDTVACSLNGYTRNGFFIRIRPASGQGFGDHASKLTNALRYNASNGAALTNSVNGSNAYTLTGGGIIVDGVQFNASNSGVARVVQLGNGTRMNKCILDANMVGSYVVSQNTGGIQMDDCLIVQRGNASGGIQILDSSFVLNACTIACPASSSGRGVNQNYATNPVVKNTVVYGFANDFQNTAGGATTNNATSNGSFAGSGWGTNGQVSVSSSEFESVTPGSEDWRVKSTSTKLAGLGAGSVTTSDIVGTTRSAGAPTIGAWEVSASAPSGLLPQFLNRSINRAVQRASLF